MPHVFADEHAMTIRERGAIQVVGENVSVLTRPDPAS
jgi:hypothetical protein